MLKLLSVRELPNGKPHIFSIKFCDKNGKIRFSHMRFHVEPVKWTIT